MILKSYKPYTSAIRNKVTIKYSFISTEKKFKKLQNKNHQLQGRNNTGKITSRHKGGGHKKLYRIIDSSRKKYDISGRIVRIDYDPYRSAQIALITYADGISKYIICPQNAKLGDLIYSTIKPESIQNYNIGNNFPLKYMLLGMKIHNIEIIPGKGGQLVKAAGTAAYIIAKDKKYVIIQLPSNEIRLLEDKCAASIGQVGNSEHYLRVLGKAGAKRWLGIRPTVRGSAMNAIDHPHGGGEGKSPIGKKSPMTPWGKPTLGFRTRKKKINDKFIIKRRYANK